MSSGPPTRPIGTEFALRAGPVSSPMANRVMLVGNGPARALHRHLPGASSAARIRVR